MPTPGAMDETTPARPPATCTITVAGHVRFLPVVRLFVGGVAREWGASEDVVSDLRLGASELAAAAVASGAGEVSVAVRQDGRTIVVSVSPLDHSALGAGDEPAGDVVGGLFDELVVGGGAVSISTGLAE